MKDSFILYNSFYEPIKNLDDVKLGKLFRAIFNYTTNGVITEDNDILIAFMFIKNQLDIDNQKYLNICERNKINGQKGGRPKKPKKPSGLSGNPEKPKKPDNDNDNDNDNNKKENIKRKKFFEKKELNDIFLEYLKVRTRLKVINTDRAVNSLLKKLEPYDDDIKYKMIEQSIVRSWKSIYELQDDNKHQNQNDDEVKLKKVGEGAFIIGG